MRWSKARGFVGGWVGRQPIKREIQTRCVRTSKLISGTPHPHTMLFENISLL